MYVTKWNIIGFLISVIFGGVIGAIVFVTCWAIFRVRMIRRGLLFIQSFLYLKVLWITEDANEASRVANNLSTSSSQAYWEEAQAFAQTVSEGKQLPVIQAAKQKGYAHRKKPIGELLFR